MSLPALTLMLAFATTPTPDTPVTGRVVAVDFTQTPALVEAFGGRRFYIEEDQGDPRSRLEWIAYDCQGEEMARTYPFDPRWTSGHPQAEPGGELGPRSNLGLSGEPLEDADAILPVDSAQFEIIERDAEGDAHAIHGPYDMPGMWCG